jgi:N-acetylglucosaminyl-diphospho-decaprenol L-rhamnosyltransferase
VSEVATEAKAVPHVSVAIVATDEAKNIVGCLESLDRSRFRNFSIVICENAGYEAFDRDIQAIGRIEGVTDVLDEDARSRRPDVRRFWLGADKRLVTLLKSPENRGYSGGVNACIAAAGDEWDFVWVLNPDTFPEPEALAALVRRQAEGGYGMVGSKLLFAATGQVQLWGGLKYWPLLGRHRSLGVGQSPDVTPNVEDVEANLDIISGASMFVSKDYIKTVGVMDEDFFVYYEDTEWSLRRGQFRFGYAHDSVVRHIAGATSGSGGPKPKRSRFSIYLSERNRVIVAKKRHPSAWPFFAFSALLQTSEYLVRFRSFRSFKIALSGWSAGVSGETGMPGFMRGSQGPATKVFLRRAD